MIREATAEVAIKLATELDERNVKLTAIPGTPLADLVNTMCLKQNDIVIVSDKLEQGAYQPNSNYIKDISSNFDGHKRGEEVLHNLKMDDVVGFLSKSVQSHLKFAKTVVKPVVTEVAQRMNDTIGNLNIDPFNGLKVVQIDLPKLLNDPSFFELLDKFKSATVIPELKNLFFSEKSAEEIIRVISENQPMAQEIQEWAAVKGEAWLEAAWKSIMTNQPASQSFQSIRGEVDANDYYLLTYLACDALHNKPEEGIALSLGNYNQTLFEFKSNAAYYLQFNAQTHFNNVKSKLLIKNYSIKEIQVVGEVYRDWIKSGGNDGIVLAAVLVDRPIVWVNLIDENIQMLTKVWERHVAMIKTANNNNRYAKFRNVLKDAIENAVRENFQLCFGHLSETNEPSTTMPEYLQYQQSLEVFLSNIKDSDFDDIWKLVLSGVCQTVFYYTDAEKILAGIETAIRKNPTLEVNEAAYLSMIEYVTDYVCDQMEISAI